MFEGADDPLVDRGRVVIVICRAWFVERWVVMLGLATAGCSPAAECAESDECPAGGVCYFGRCTTPDGGGESSDDADGVAEADVRPDGGTDVEVADDAAGEDGRDGPGEIEAIGDVEILEDVTAEVLPECDGALVGGHCWYASLAGESCDTACTPHGGCDVAGTRDYAGSGGTDAQCVAVLVALGYGSYPHQDFSNNDLGCHFAWGSWTYWSTALPTTCGAAAGGSAAAERMCACAR